MEEPKLIVEEDNSEDDEDEWYARMESAAQCVDYDNDLDAHAVAVLQKMTCTIMKMSISTRWSFVLSKTMGMKRLWKSLVRSGSL